MAHHVNTDQHRASGNARPAATGIVLAFGAAVTAACVALNSAPAAHADDDFSRVISNMERVTDFGYQDLSTGYHDMITDDMSKGLSEYLAGLNDITVGPGANFLIDTTSLLSGEHVQGTGTFPAIPVPADLTAAFTEAGHSLSHAGTSLTTAADSLFAGEFTDAAKDAVRGFDAAFLFAPDSIVLGVANTLPDGAVDLLPLLL